MDARTTVGGNGGVYVAGTDATPGNFFAIQALSEATFSDIACNITALPDNLVLAAGVTIYGIFSTFTLASGAVIAYRADK